MQDALLYGVNIYFSSWLMFKSILAHGQAVCSQGGHIGNATRVEEFWERYTENESPDTCHVTSRKLGCCFPLVC